MKHSHGLVAVVYMPHGTGTAEWEAAPRAVTAILSTRSPTLAADNTYHTTWAVQFVQAVSDRAVTAHAAQNTKRSGGPAIDLLTTRRLGCTISRTSRKRIEEIFG